MRPQSATLSVDTRRVLEAVPLDPSLLPGARNVVDVHLRVRPDEHVALVHDVGEEPLARALLDVLHALHAHVSVIALAGPETDAQAARVAATLASSDAAIHVYREAPRSPARARWLAAGRGARHVALVGVTPSVAMQSLRANPLELTRLSSAVASRFAHARTTEITTATGTNLVARHAASDAIRVEDGSVGDDLPVAFLPSGEVTRECTRVDGELVADGGVWLDGSQAFGLATRVTLRFEEGRVVEVRGLDSERLAAKLDASGIPLTVATIGLGTNPTVLTPVRELAQDARMPGVHVVLGRLRDLEDATTPRIHVLVRRPDVRFDVTTVMVNGRYARDIAG